MPEWVKEKKPTLDESNPVEKYRAEERRAFERWKDYALRSWESANEYRKALGKPLLPKPEWSDKSFADACKIVVEKARKDFEKKFSELRKLEEELKTKKTSSAESAEGSISLIGKPKIELLDRNGNTESGAADAENFLGSKTCARCGTADENAKISHICNSTIDQWAGKQLCWKCYVDTHVETYLKDYICPECKGKIVEWAGTYDNWSDMRCERGHITNVNFLVKAEKTEIESGEPEKVERIRKDRSAEELVREFGNISIEDAYELYLNAKISLTEYDVFSEYLSRRRDAESQQEDG
ncbi:MAG: hypothetical protein QME59_07485, partial [Candidatus Hydrothermarchaeota archaeon]|nr:hypothetical protein [Candidatus Hydrothermarchaeota archaeon]